MARPPRTAASSAGSMVEAPRRTVRTLRRSAAAAAAGPETRPGTEPTTSTRSLKRHYSGLARVLSEAMARGTPSRGVLEEEESEMETKDGKYEEASSESEGELPALTARAERATTRSLRRLAKHWRPEPGGDALRTSVLEDHSTSDVVRLHYLALVDNFLETCEKDGKELRTAEEVDECMVKALTDMYFEGRDLGVGTKLVAGWMACFPRFGRAGDLRMPRSWRALKGWRRLAPPRSRVGAVLFVIAGIAALLVKNGHIDMALWTLLGFGGYLRPSTNMRLRRGSLIPPVPSLTEYWAVLLNPSEFFERSKMGVADESVMWDVPELLWMKRAFELMRQGDRTQKVWNFSYPEVAKQIAVAAAQLDVEFVPYQLRHSGPSWDRLKERRTLKEIQKRGHWGSFSSVTRYERAAVVMAEYEKLDPDLRVYLEKITANLERHVRDNLEVPSPPVRTGLHWERAGNALKRRDHTGKARRLY